MNWAQFFVYVSIALFFLAAISPRLKMVESNVNLVAAGLFCWALSTQL